jgi:hypothetical protein
MGMSTQSSRIHHQGHAFIDMLFDHDDVSAAFDSRACKIRPQTSFGNQSSKAFETSQCPTEQQDDSDQYDLLMSSINLDEDDSLMDLTEESECHQLPEESLYDPKRRIFEWNDEFSLLTKVSKKLPTVAEDYELRCGHDMQATQKGTSFSLTKHKTPVNTTSWGNWGTICF